MLSTYSRYHPTHYQTFGEYYKVLTDAPRQQATEDDRGDTPQQLAPSQHKARHYRTNNDIVVAVQHDHDANLRPHQIDQHTITTYRTIGGLVVAHACRIQAVHFDLVGHHTTHPVMEKTIAFEEIPLHEDDTPLPIVLRSEHAISWLIRADSEGYAASYPLHPVSPDSLPLHGPS